MIHLFKVLNIKLWRGNRVMWERHNLKNILHTAAQQYALRCLFNTTEASVPSFYYAGLDNRVSPAASDVLSELDTEPATFGYQRVAISSADGFVVSLNDGGLYQATTGVITFNGTGGTWGPVQNVFLATTADNTGVLISTIALDGPHFVGNGEKLTMQFGVSLGDCD